MFKINLTGADETVRLSEDAGLVCAPRDIETMGEILQDLRETEEDLTMNAMAKALAQEVVRGWYGLFDEGNAEIAFDPDLVPAVMSDPVVLQAFRDQYLNRLLYLREEGNGSTPSQNGTSGAEETTATAASKSAKPAPTARKGRSPSKAAKSGG